MQVPAPPAPAQGSPSPRASEPSLDRIALFANVALRAQVHGMQLALQALEAEGSLSALDGMLAPWSERQRIVRKPPFDQLEDTYSDE